MQFVIEIPEDKLIDAVQKALAPLIGSLSISPGGQVVQQSTWLTYTNFQRVLIEKGYRAKSYQTIISIAEMNNVKYEKRGRELWFWSDDANAVPSKR